MVVRYSFLKLFTGFAIAALIDSKLIVNKAMPKIKKAVSPNTHHGISILYS